MMPIAMTAATVLSLVHDAAAPTAPRAAVPPPLPTKESDVSTTPPPATAAIAAPGFAVHAQAPAPAAPVAVQGDLVDTLKLSGQFTTFVGGIDATNLAGLLKTNKNLTVFAPTDAAFAAMPADQAALLAAFREGLGMPGLPAQGLTPEFMRLLGQLIHESARGTVDLLVACAALKREVRAEATMIVAKENNPLKFSPSVEVALQHLLGPPAPGFMPPAAAVRDAFDPRTRLRSAGPTSAPNDSNASHGKANTEEVAA